MSTLDLADRDLRQRQLVPPERLARCHALVIGVGAIGRQVAQQLAAVGVARLTLIDHDQVSVENLAAQAYWPIDLGQPKVSATAELCRLINPQVHLQTFAERFRRSSVSVLPCFGSAEEQPIVFCCVDSIATRSLIWNALRHHAAFFVDGRMSAEVIRILTAGQPATDSEYATTLFAPEQAYVGSCTARSTVYAASIAAGLMLGQFTRWLRKLPLERDLTLNLLSSELTVA